MTADPAGKSLSAKLLALVERNKVISAALDLPSLIEEIFDAAEGVLGHDRLALFERTAEGSELEVAGCRGDYPDVVLGLRLPVTGAGVTTWAFRQGEACIVNDVSKDERHLPGRAKVGSELAVPLALGAEPIGVLDVQRDVCDAFTEEDALLLSALASHAAVAMHDLRAREELSRQKRRLHSIVECSPDAIVTTDRAGRITTFSPGAEAMFGFAAGEMVGERVTDYYLEGEAEARRVQAQVDERGEVRNLETWFKTASGAQLPASLSASLLRETDGTVVGTLGVLKDITAEKRLAAKLSHTIQMLEEANEKLGHLALTDSLTGLSNQRHFRARLEEELERGGRTGCSVCLLMIDIDKFKSFNDRFGHQVGDRILFELGRTLKRSIRQIDLGCRYGGEEFTVILPETSQQDGLVVARRIQRAFREREAWVDLGVEPPSLSLGLAEGRPRGRDDSMAEGLLREADEAMYRAKHRGGDDIELA